MAHRFLGLDMGSSSVKAVMLAGSGKNWEIVDHFEEPLEPGDELHWRERLKAALGKVSGRLKADTVIVSLPPSSTVVTQLKLPVTDSRKIAATVGFELESLIPFELNEVVYEYRVDAKTDDTSEISVIYVKREDVASVLEALDSVKADPRYIAAPAQSLKFISGMMDPEKAGEGPHVIIDVGSSFCIVCIADDRSIPVSRGFRVIGGSEGGGISTDELANQIAGNVNLVSSAYISRTGRIPRSVFLCGGRSLTPGLAEGLAERLKARCETVPWASTMGLEPQEMARFALAYAMAFQAATGFKKDIVNLRSGAFAFKGGYNFIREKLPRMGVAALLVIVLAVANAAFESRGLSGQERMLDDKLMEITKQLLGKPYEDYKIALTVMKQKISPHANSIPKITALDYFMEISSHLPKDVSLDLREVNIQTGKIRIEGETENFEAVDKIVNGLKSNKCFEDINKGRVKKSIDGTRVEFDLNITPKC